MTKKPGFFPGNRARGDLNGPDRVGRAGSFNPEEHRSSRFRSYGPPLLGYGKNGYVLIADARLIFHHFLSRGLDP